MIEIKNNIGVKIFYRLIVLIEIVLLIAIFIFALRVESIRKDIVNDVSRSHFTQLEINQQESIELLEIFIVINILLAFVAFFLVNRNLHFMDQLVYQVTQILKGDYSVRNEVKTENELGLLGRTLNQMCDSIVLNIDQYKKINHILGESEERFRSMVENSPIGTAITTLDGKFVFVNDAMCHFLGYKRDKFIHMSIRDITQKEDYPNELALINQLIEEKIDYFRLYKQSIHKNGNLIWTLLNVTTIKSPDGKPMQLTVQLEDVNDRIQNENKITEMNESLLTLINELERVERNEALINKMNELLQICLTSQEAFPRISLMANQLFPELSGGLSILNKSTGKMETVIQWGKQIILVDLFHPDDCFAIRGGNIVDIPDPQKSVLCSHYLTVPSGGLMELPMIVQGDIIGVTSFFAAANTRIIEKQKQIVMNFNNTIKTSLANIRLRELLSEQSMHDPLTGLYNRRYLSETLPHILQHAERSNHSVSIVMLDLDYFKQLNDSFGHDAGDEELRFMGRLLLKSFRGGDIACRYGGEEFLIVILDANLENVCKRMEQLSQEVKNSKIVYRDKLIPAITVSVGIAIAPLHANTAEGLITAADAALYKAKALGRARVEVYQPGASSVR